MAKYFSEVECVGTTLGHSCWLAGRLSSLVDYVG
jgi:hypothetical protein